MDYKYFREIEVPILEKNDNNKKYNEKKSYRQPQFKEIGRVNNITKGGDGNSSFDNSWQANDPFNISS